MMDNIKNIKKELSYLNDNISRNIILKLKEKNIASISSQKELISFLKEELGKQYEIIMPLIEDALDKAKEEGDLPQK
jgi:hypothetical protein